MGRSRRSGTGGSARAACLPACAHAPGRHAARRVAVRMLLVLIASAIPRFVSLLGRQSRHAGGARAVCFAIYTICTPALPTPASSPRSPGRSGRVCAPGSAPCASPFPTGRGERRGGRGTRGSTRPSTASSTPEARSGTVVHACGFDAKRPTCVALPTAGMCLMLPHLVVGHVLGDALLPAAAYRVPAEERAAAALPAAAVAAEESTAAARPRCLCVQVAALCTLQVQHGSGQESRRGESRGRRTCPQTVASSSRWPVQLPAAASLAAGRAHRPPLRSAIPGSLQQCLEPPPALQMIQHNTCKLMRTFKA